VVTVLVAADVLDRFAALLSYPGPEVARAARACAAAVGGAGDEAAALVARFAAFAEEAAPGRLEEVYTALFELDAGAPPYLGHHLFGESYKRSVFLLLLAATRDGELRADLVEAALLPVLARLGGDRTAAADGAGAAAGGEETAAGGGEAEAADGAPPADARAAYAALLRALRLVLERSMAPTGGEGGA
jgi:hypothetical protein